MVGHLGVRDVRAQRRRHVTSRTVRLLRVMLEAKGRTVAGQAFPTIVRRSLMLSGMVVRIVTTDTGHRIARFNLAFALPQSFKLAVGPQSRSLGSRKNVMADVIVENLARTEIVGVAPGALHFRPAFQIALHANRIAAL